MMFVPDATSRNSHRWHFAWMIVALLLHIAACTPVEQEVSNQRVADTVRTIECMVAGRLEYLTLNELLAKVDSIEWVDGNTLGLHEFHYRYVERMPKLNAIYATMIESQRTDFDLDSVVKLVRNPHLLRVLAVVYLPTDTTVFFKDMIAVPPELCNCVSLDDINLHAWKIVANAPIALACMRRLTHLDLNAAFVSSNFDYSHIPKLENASINVNGRDADRVLQQVATCRKLRNLSLTIFDIDSSASVDSITVCKDLYNLRVESLEIRSRFPRLLLDWNLLKRMKRLKSIVLMGKIDSQFVNEMRANTYPYWIQTDKALDTGDVYYRFGRYIELKRH